MRAKNLWIRMLRLPACGLFFLAFSMVLDAQERPVPVVLQVPSTNVHQVFFYGERRGFYQQEGLDLRIIVMRPNLATATLMSGDSQFTGQFQTAFYAGLRGVPVKALMIVNARPGWYLVAGPDIKNGKELKGKTIGVSGLGTSTQYAAMKAVTHFGLDAQRDVTYLGLGDDQAKLSAFKAGLVQAIQIITPWQIEARKFGGRELLFLGDVLELPTSGLGTSDKLLKENPRLVKRMLRASLKATRAIRQHPADFSEFLTKFYKLDREQATLAAEMAGKTISPDGLLSAAGLKALLESGKQSGAIVGTAKPENGTDFTPLREVLHELDMK
jgi:NitT/TauT family transport system substrate-binding protein